MSGFQTESAKAVCSCFKVFDVAVSHKMFCDQTCLTAISVFHNLQHLVKVDPVVLQRAIEYLSSSERFVFGCELQCDSIFSWPLVLHDLFSVRSDKPDIDECRGPHHHMDRRIEGRAYRAIGHHVRDTTNPWRSKIWTLRQHNRGHLCQRIGAIGQDIRSLTLAIVLQNQQVVIFTLFNPDRSVENERANSSKSIP